MSKNPVVQTQEAQRSVLLSDRVRLPDADHALLLIL